MTTSIVILALSCLQLTSALLFSPTLLRINPFGVVSPRKSFNASPASSSTDQIIAPPSSILTSSTVDYSHDDDVLRYKYELLTSVYEKSLERGFEEL
eukprot:scaffold248393_cov85-Cyclotella_meneghiniana.AAC.5